MIENPPRHTEQQQTRGASEDSGGVAVALRSQTYRHNYPLAPRNQLPSLALGHERRTATSRQRESYRDKQQKGLHIVFRDIRREPLLRAAAQLSLAPVSLRCVRLPMTDPTAEAEEGQTSPPSSQVSIIVPFFNEEESISRLRHRQRGGAIKGSRLKWSSSTTAPTPRSRSAPARQVGFARADRQVQATGQTPAMAAGIQHARGSVLVTMDGDLQNDPADIADFSRSTKASTSSSAGGTTGRQLISRKIPSKSRIGSSAKSPGADQRQRLLLEGYRASLIRTGPLYRNAPVIPAMASIAGPRIAEIKIRHHAPIRQVEVRAIAGLQSASGSLGDQDCCVFHLASTLVRTVVVARDDRGHFFQLRHAICLSMERCPCRLRERSDFWPLHSFQYPAALGELVISSAMSASSSPVSPKYRIVPSPLPDRSASMLESASPVELSVVIPVGRRQSDMASSTRVQPGLDRVGASYEMIFVLDGPQPAARLACPTRRGAPVRYSISPAFSRGNRIGGQFEHAASAIV